MSSINYKEKYDEYHNKFWKLYHEKKALKEENIKLKIRLDIYEKRILYGEVKRISSHLDYGILNNSEYGDIFFHSSQCKFNINNLLIGKRLKFNMIFNKKLEAINLELQINESLSAFDILDSGIYKSNSLQIDEISDNTSESNLSESSESCESFISCNDVTDIKYNNNILSEDNYKENYEEDLKSINNAKKIWYMNCKMKIIDDKKNSWLNSIDNGFVFTWLKPKVNQKLSEKLKIGDIIAWYMIGNGYSGIVRVNGYCSLMNKDDLKLHYPDKNEKEIKDHLEWEKSSNCRIIKIPVEFLAYTDLNNCIRKQLGWLSTDWTSGFRGSSAISPKHSRWKEQVITMYKEMKNKPSQYNTTQEVNEEQESENNIITSNEQLEYGENACDIAADRMASIIAEEISI